jgi:hypothetical protein
MRFHAWDDSGFFARINFQSTVARYAGRRRSAAEPQFANPEADASHVFRIGARGHKTSFDDRVVHL